MIGDFISKLNESTIIYFITNFIRISIKHLKFFNYIVFNVKYYLHSYFSSSAFFPRSKE